MPEPPGSEPVGTPESSDRLHVLDHPLSQQKLAVLRDRETSQRDFRQAMRELALILVSEATRKMPTVRVQIETPLAPVEVQRPSEPVCMVPVLRAGLGMLDGALALMPEATVGFIGLFRDEATARPVEYYANLPQDLERYRVLVLDPMLATGGSLSATLAKLKDYGASRIACLNAVAAVSGVERVLRDHPEVDIFIGAVDPELDDNSFIVPGLGDAGDRLYGTL